MSSEYMQWMEGWENKGKETCFYIFKGHVLCRKHDRKLASHDLHLKIESVNDWLSPDVWFFFRKIKGTSWHPLVARRDAPSQGTWISDVKTKILLSYITVLLILLSLCPSLCPCSFILGNMLHWHTRTN